MRTKMIAMMISLALMSAVAIARDSQNMHSLNDALNTPSAKQKLDPDVKLYFGNQNHPKVERKIGVWGSNKKTNAFGKSDKKACEWAFLSATLTMQARAKAEGGNAIINIKSNYKNIEISSDTEYMCGAGALMAGVALKGEVVKLVK